VAGGYTTRQIVAFAVVVAVVPSLLVVAPYLVLRRVHRRTAEVLHVGLVAVLGAAFGNVLLRGVGGDGDGAAAAAALVGAGVAVALVRFRPGALLLQYLAGAQVLFVVAFLVVSPSSALLGGGPDEGSLGSVSVPVPPGPVVVLVFDELPLPTLMRTDGTINAERYPSFARLAEESTWFRNTSSSYHHTDRAVPALLTGSLMEGGDLPTYRSLPRNLLALLATEVPVERYEPVTDLCPPTACRPRDAQPLRQAIEDAAVVLGHRALPPSLREDLPAIDEAWGSFGAAVGGGAEERTPDAEDPLARWHGTGLDEREPVVQARRLVEHGGRIGTEPALHLIHVVLPHVPWFTTPWGTQLMRPMPDWHDDPGDPLSGWSALIRFQRHSLQTGAADVALGAVLDHLDAIGAWDQTTLVVVADHGTSTIPPHVRREPTPENEDEVYRVPLFVKAAGQQVGEVRDDVAMTIDVLPTLLDLLDVETDWEMDGHSLLDGSDASTAPIVTPELEGLFTIVRRHAADFPHGWDWAALAAVGEWGHLVGTPVDELAVGAPSDRTWHPNNEGAFAALPKGDRVPQLVTGRIGAGGGGDPPDVVLVANGTVAGVAGGFDRSGDEWRFSSLLGPFLVDGRNAIDAYEVAEEDGEPVLHRLG
jgi:hypothetical protein